MPPKFKRNLSQEDLMSAPNVEKERLLNPDDENEDDDFFLRGPTSKSRKLLTEDSKVRQVQFQVDEVTGIMKENIGKIMERGDRLEELEDKSEMLSTHADQFTSSAKKMRNRMWWRNIKMKILLAVVIIVILLIIFVPIIVKNT
ncbi:vesicle-associated membrane protein 4-like isoform X1 [Limulus polyphemus]|uniref:Vesicle-associated membrane protein 4-like isoform X1 n=1 Tax=Limulus polyphemus TaxID=6850 RepID=A0ABM1C3Q1_LIMPO|nr:vesicle-associated membrane protein 4-like isoform X1 [Limulus polyphemus]